MAIALTSILAPSTTLVLQAEGRSGGKRAYSFNKAGEDLDVATPP